MYFGTTTIDRIQPQLSDLNQVVDYESKGIPSSSHEREGGDHEESSWRNIYEKCMQPKLRLKQRTMNSNRSQTVYSHPTKLTVKLKGQQCQSQAIDSSNGVRVCADCNTTTTPLWRGGPLGPKSLCNACGIRQRKAKRAMAAATEASSKEKRWKTNHSTQSKKPCKPQGSSTNQSRKQTFFRNVEWNLSRNSSNLERVFPPDVEVAAILLMELSSGSIYS